jgi:DMSO/TMAO reductase YedYZ molybdopterin-dependent catalytic subunit
MAGRRTNLALAGALALALATGAGAFAAGTERGRWVVVAHGAAGLALVLLTPWKSVVVRRGLRRRPRPGRASAVALGVVVVLTLLAGVAHSTGLARSLGLLTAMQLHVGAGLLAAVLAVRHVLTRPQRPRRADLGRRGLLRLGALAGSAALAWGAVEGLVAVAGLPGGRRRFTGSYEAGSFAPARMPVTQWLDDRVPTSARAADGQGYRLVVRADAGTRSWTLAELAAFDDRVRATLDCTGGWWATQDWAGVRLGRLLPEGRTAGRSGAIEVISVTGYRRRFPAAEADRLLLATRVGTPEAGMRPLSPGHGFPVRLVAPGRRGFWWVKWVERIEVGGRPWWAQPPFPPT